MGSAGRARLPPLYRMPPTSSTPTPTPLHSSTTLKRSTSNARTNQCTTDDTLPRARKGEWWHRLPASSTPLAHPRRNQFQSRPQPRRKKRCLGSNVNGAWSVELRDARRARREKTTDVSAGKDGVSTTRYVNANRNVVSS
ncbi:hypothetical protein PMAYCL1PPCAC_30813 [Pristionchus mayeri]|uniref:Uncharacterized protein n=1 Tax=Pristionchus mayeri TaxID=1317129 RepID=A0AAN5DBR3_9BILA|nr:hypothetical protein PMAYCL1PPCAC_30813 [Pristionchus mayeri]